MCVCVCACVDASKAYLPRACAGPPEVQLITKLERGRGGKTSWRSNIFLCVCVCVCVWFPGLTLMMCRPARGRPSGLRGPLDLDPYPTLSLPACLLPHTRFLTHLTDLTHTQWDMYIQNMKCQVCKVFLNQSISMYVFVCVPSSEIKASVTTQQCQTFKVSQMVRLHLCTCVSVYHTKLLSI